MTPSLKVDRAVNSSLNVQGFPDRDMSRENWTSDLSIDIDRYHEPFR